MCAYDKRMQMKQLDDVLYQQTSSTPITAIF
jgi:hypothetical protein